MTFRTFTTIGTGFGIRRSAPWTIRMYLALNWKNFKRKNRNFAAMLAEFLAWVSDRKLKKEARFADAGTKNMMEMTLAVSAFCVQNVGQCRPQRL